MSLSGFDPWICEIVYKRMLFPLPHAVVCIVLETEVEKHCCKDPLLAYTRSYGGGAVVQSRSRSV